MSVGRELPLILVCRSLYHHKWLSIALYRNDTANTFLRGSGLGNWAPAGGRMFGDAFWFFRYKPDGTFASIAKGLDRIVLSQDGNQFTASGTVQDFDATNTLISTGCVTHSAARLTAPAQGN